MTHFVARASHVRDAARASVTRCTRLALLLTALCFGLLASVNTTGAWAVWPGKPGHLLLYSIGDQLYAPPSATPVTPAPNLANPRYSADDQLVVGMTSTSSSASVAVENTDGSNERTVITPPSGTQYLQPSFLPDGQHVVFVGNDGANTWIDEIGIDGTGLTTLFGPQPYASGLIQSPEVSPDGSLIVFTNLYGNNYSINRIDGMGSIDLIPAGGTTGSPTSVAENSRAPRFSSDGQHLTFMTEEEQIPGYTPYTAVRVTDLNGSDLQTTMIQTSYGQQYYVSPTFTPDGQYVTFEDCLNSNCGVYSKRLPYAPASANAPTMREDVALGNNNGCCVSIPEWEPAPRVGPDITSGPDGTSASRTATFEFTEDSGASYECSLDGAAYASCDTPATFSNLADGSHTFRVRIADTGAGAGPPSEWDWTVDASAPVVTIDSAPSGAANGPTATITFHGSKPNLAFVCSLDGGAGQPCSSPDNLTGLSPGSHRLDITATDDGGNSSVSPASVQWGVSSTSTPLPGGAPPPESTCAAPAQAAATSGELTMVGRSGTCLTHDAVLGWMAHGPVTLNGISVVPDPSTVLYLSDTLGTGSFIARGPVTVQLGDFDSVHLPRLAWSQSGANTLDSASKAYGLVKGLIAGLPALPSSFPTIALSGDNGGTAVISQKVALPDIFSALPGGSEKVAVTLKLTASNNQGLSISGKISVGELWLGSIQLKGLELGYDNGSFEGAVGADFLAGPGLKIAIKLGSPPAPALLGCCLQKFALSVQKINRPIGTSPIFLQSIGGSASQAGGFLTIGGTVGLTLGPDIPDIGAALSFDGGLSLALSNPWAIEATGGASLFSFPLADGKMTYTSGRGATVTGAAKVTVGGYGVSAEIKNSFFEGRSRFNIQAVGTVALPVLGSTRALAVFSSGGFAACATVHSPLSDYAIGWGVRFPGRVPELFADTCNMGPYTVTPSAAAITPPGRARVMRLSAGVGARLLAVHGVGGAPAVTVTGPHGLRLSGSGIQRDGTIIPDAAHHTTFVVFAVAPAGRYSVVSSRRAISSVQVAGALPPVRVHAQTRALRSGRRQLRFTQVVAPGNHLELMERGSSGAGRLLLRTARPRGELVYRPSPGLGRQRWIVAVTLDRHGIIRDTRRVASYRVVDRRPARILRLRVSKQHRLTWAADPGAVTYVIAFTTQSGTRVVNATHPRAAIPATTTSASVEAVDAAGRASPVARIAVARR